jgi:hypothetical protein
MRMSRVLLAGVAVAATAAATSAFTASNTVQDSVAGFDASTVTGATTKHVNYVLNGTDKSVVDEIQFELNENLDTAVTEGLQAWLTLQQGGVTVVGTTPILCDIEAFTTVTPVKCDTTGTLLESFNGVALTVAE